MTSTHLKEDEVRLVARMVELACEYGRLLMACWVRRVSAGDSVKPMRRTRM